MAYLKVKMSIHPAKEAQIVLLLVKKVTNLVKYLDFVNVFSKRLAIELSKLSKINKHLINLEPDKQLLYSSIYNLRLVKLKIFKTYIKINLAKSFIQPFKSLARTFILFA